MARIRDAINAGAVQPHDRVYADVAPEADEVGVANAGSKVLSSTPKPPKTAGEKVTDEGEGGSKIAEYLVSQKII